MARRVAAWLLGALTLAGLAVAAPPAAARPNGRQGGGQVVLVVHTAGRPEPTNDLATGARTALPDAVLRHDFPAEHAFSIAVPRADERSALRSLRAQPGVRFVERPVQRHFFAVPDDPGFAKQRSYLQAVRAPQAWDQDQGAPTVTIAVVDSGIDVQHPDLSGKIAGTYNAHTGTSDITDTVGHGTFVAGVAAAATDNDIGIAGAGYNTRILGVKIADAHGVISIDDEAAGIRWAVNHGANIINLSIGGPDPSPLERRAIEYAQAKNVLVVAAAGNAHNAAKQYPAAYPGVLAVGATNTSRDTRASFSSYGSWVDLAAPGVGIYSTTVPDGTTAFPSASAYAYGDGTSFAAALVSGAAALVDAKNPTLSAPEVRAILVDSAHGYRGLGLGAGQVDFLRALRATAPTTAPTAVTARGQRGRVLLRAQTAASAVAFRIDDGPERPPVPTSNGTAQLRWPSWGYSNGQHELRAYNCSSGGACGAHATATTFVLDNAAPVITAPAPGARRTGRFLVRAQAPDGGALRLYVDGHAVAFARTAPYRLWVNGSELAAGRHSLQVRSCSPDGRHCAGPASNTVRVRIVALRPRILALRPREISPNGDGVQDTATLRYRLAEGARVVVQILDAAGNVVRSTVLGRLPAGVHTWNWRAPRLRDGRYTIAVADRRPTGTGNGNLRGWASTSGFIDTQPPRFTAPTNENGVVFPVRDGFRDRFVTQTRVADRGALTMTITSATGRRVADVRRYVTPGPVRMVWNGRSAGRIVPPGTYHWRLRLRDPAGNTRVSRSFVLHVSAKHLVTSRVVLREVAHRSFDFGRTNPQCTAARPKASTYRYGILLTNSCPPRSLDLAYARFRFAVPQARTYRRLSFAVIGTATRRPSELSATVDRTDSRVEKASFVTVHRAGQQVVPMATVPAAKHVTGRRQVFATILLDSRYPTANGFDLRAVTLRVVLTRLRR